MTELPLTLSLADYARMMPLATGQVKPDGIALMPLLGWEGSWLTFVPPSRLPDARPSPERREANASSPPTTAHPSARPSNEAITTRGSSTESNVRPFAA